MWSSFGEYCTRHSLCSYRLGVWSAVCVYWYNLSCACVSSIYLPKCLRHGKVWLPTLWYSKESLDNCLAIFWYTSVPYVLEVFSEATARSLCCLGAVNLLLGIVQALLLYGFLSQIFFHSVLGNAILCDSITLFFISFWILVTIWGTPLGSRSCFCCLYAFFSQNTLCIPQEWPIILQICYPCHCILAYIMNKRISGLFSYFL